MTISLSGIMAFGIPSAGRTAHLRFAKALSQRKSPGEARRECQEDRAERTAGSEAPRNFQTRHPETPDDSSYTADTRARVCTNPRVFRRFLGTATAGYARREMTW